MVPPDSFWPGGHTHIRGKLPLLGHKPRCCTSTWPSHSFLRGRSHIMAPKLRNIIEFNVNKMSLSVWFTAINRQWLALSGWGINVPMFLLFFGLLLQTFSFWAMHFVTHLVTGMKRPKKSFSLHSFLWRPQKAEPQNDQKKSSGRENFRVEIERERKWVSVPTCLPFKVITNHLSRLEKLNFFRKLNLIHEIHFLKDDGCYLCVVIYCAMKMFSYSRRICREYLIWVDWVVLFENPEEQSNTGSTNCMSLGRGCLLGWPMTDMKNVWETCLKTVISLMKLVTHKLDSSP